MAPEPLKQLGKYQLVDLLGEGAMGVVYRAFDRVLNRYLAIKVMSSVIASDTKLRERFLREARTAGSLQHPNVITIYDFGEVDDHLFIAMEFVEGEDLAEIIARREKLSIARKLDLIIDTLNGLAYAHNRGVVHRDVKPANIRISSDVRAKVMDFGIARLQQSELTQSGVLLGTPQYMAPEQVTGAEITAASDIFAVGAVLYELLSYTRPFEGDSLHVILYNIVSTDPPPVSQRAAGIPIELDAILAKALAKDPANRYPNAMAMAKALSAARLELSPGDDAATIALRASSAPGGPPTVLRTSQIQHMIAEEVAKKQRWGMWAGVGGGVALVAALLVYASKSSGNRPPANAANDSTQLSASPTAQISQPPASALGTETTAPPIASAPPVRPPAGRTPDPRTPATKTATQGRAESPPATVTAAADTVAPAMRNSVLKVRQRAQDAGATPAEIARGDSALRAGDAAAAQSRSGEAIAQFGAASALWADAERTARDRAAAAAAERNRPVTPPPVTPPVTQQEPVTRAPVDPRPEIERVIATYERAIQSGSVAEIRRAYPGLTPQQQQGWESFFRSIANFKPRLTVDAVSVNGATATVGIAALYEYDNRTTSRPDRQQFRLQATLNRETSGWQLAAIR